MTDEEREPLEGSGDPDEESIFDPGQGFSFWKPEVAGQELRGRFVRIKLSGQYGPTLRFRTDDGLKAVALTDQLADVDWRALVGRSLILRFLGWVETKRGYKMRSIKVAAVKDEIPF